MFLFFLSQVQSMPIFLDARDALSPPCAGPANKKLTNLSMMKKHQFFERCLNLK